MPRFSSFLAAFAVLSFALAQPLAAAVEEWFSSFAYELNAKSPRLPNGQAVFRLRCRGNAGDEVTAFLFGPPDANGKHTPLRSLMFEYDISGTGRGEWEPAQARDGVAGFRARIPDSGLLDFRVRGEAGAAQNLIVDFSIRTAHARPAFLSAPKEILDSVPDGQSAKFTMYFPRAGAHHEFEVRSNAATPRIVISDANGGGGFGYETLEESGKVGLYRFVVPAEDKYQISVNLADYTAGSFVLRPWQPARLQRR